MEITGSPATTATAGTAYAFQPSLKQGSGTVTYAISGKPSWATFSESTGELTGTPATSNEGKTAAITISASNGSTTSSLAAFSIQVNAATAKTGSATLVWNAPVTNTNGTEVTALAGYHIYYGTNESAMNNTITVSSPTDTLYTISGLAPGTYYFSVVAYNSMGVDSTDSNIASKTIT